MPLVVGAIMLGISGCASKGLQSGGETQSSQQEAKNEASQDMKGEAGLNATDSSAPDTAFSEKDPSGGLHGLDKNPSEERVGESINTAMVAKSDSKSADSKNADPKSAARQMDQARNERTAMTAGGLRDVFFAFDSFVIQEEGRQTLSRNAGWIKSNPSIQVIIEGHCDERGTSAYNLVLGEKRAKAARNYFVELGVASSQLSMVSYGKERPICKEHDESCYGQNRRAHIVVKTDK